MSTPIDFLYANKIFLAVCAERGISCVENIIDTDIPQIKADVMKRYGAGKKVKSQLEKMLTPEFMTEQINWYKEYAAKFPEPTQQTVRERVKERLLAGKRLSKREAEWVLSIIDADLI